MNRRAHKPGAMGKIPVVPMASACLLITFHAHAQWTHFAANPARLSVNETTPPPLTPSWTAAHDLNGDPISFVGLAGIVVDEHIYALGDSAGAAHLYAFDHTGSTIWQTPVAPPELDSWSTPALGDGLVIVAAAQCLAAFDAHTGDEAWTIDLPGIVVNASPAIADERVFITTHEPFADALLLCATIDGEVLWQTSIGSASGATPALADGVVYVANVEGQILAFDATTDETPAPLWISETLDSGFFGAPVVTKDAVYAATYGFGAGQFNSTLIKVSLQGETIWTTACGRTNATPIIDADRIYLSTGLAGFGALPSVQTFTDHGNHAELDWDSALDSWIDDNDNGVIDEGEYLSIGGWTHQPILTPQGLLVGTIDANGGFFDAYTDLRLVDVDVEPSDPGFILDHTDTCGSTPALTTTGLFSMGQTGLHAFRSCTADCNADGVLNILDFVCFQQRFTSGDMSADCTNDGVLNILDFVCYQQRFTQGCES